MMELEPTGLPVSPPDDPRPRLAEPLPVRLIAVDDVTLLAAAGLEVDLDAFYIKLLGFERRSDLTRLAYRADNFDIQFTILEPPFTREDLRAIGIEIPSLRDMERELLDRNIPYAWEKGLTPGVKSILLQDPAGNWLQLSEVRAI